MNVRSLTLLMPMACAGGVFLSLAFGLGSLAQAFLLCGIFVYVISVIAVRLIG